MTLRRCRVRGHDCDAGVGGLARYAAALAPRENKFGEFIIVVQASRLHSPYRQSGRLHHN